MDLHPDFKDLLAEFARFEVRYALRCSSALAAK
jgi:hypothetical protein